MCHVGCLSKLHLVNVLLVSLKFRLAFYCPHLMLVHLEKVFVAETLSTE